MGGINRAKSYMRLFTESRKSTGIKCVFISHQQKDKEVCRKIADYLINADIDVYFDEDDDDLKHYRITNNPQGVVDSIRRGINASSHMLCVISPSTVNSYWVPWEIGFGYDKVDIGVLTLKGFSDTDLPAYLKTTKIIRGTKTLNAYLSYLTGRSEVLMENSGLIKKNTMQAHPLDNYIDWQL